MQGGGRMRASERAAAGYGGKEHEKKPAWGFFGVSAGARTRTEGVGGLYGIQFHHGHIEYQVVINGGDTSRKGALPFGRALFCARATPAASDAPTTFSVGALSDCATSAYSVFFASRGYFAVLPLVPPQAVGRTRTEGFGGLYAIVCVSFPRTTDSTTRIAS